MSDVPPSYRTLRTGWSVVHIVIIVLVCFRLSIWWGQEHGGADLARDRWEWMAEVQSSIANSIRFPWDSA